MELVVFAAIILYPTTACLVSLILLHRKRAFESLLSRLDVTIGHAQVSFCCSKFCSKFCGNGGAAKESHFSPICCSVTLKNIKYEASELAVDLDTIKVSICTAPGCTTPNWIFIEAGGDIHIDVKEQLENPRDIIALKTLQWVLLKKPLLRIGNALSRVLKVATAGKMKLVIKEEGGFFMKGVAGKHSCSVQRVELAGLLEDKRDTWRPEFYLHDVWYTPVRGGTRHASKIGLRTFLLKLWGFNFDCTQLVSIHIPGKIKITFLESTTPNAFQVLLMQGPGGGRTRKAVGSWVGWSSQVQELLLKGPGDGRMGDAIENVFKPSKGVQALFNSWG